MDNKKLVKDFINYVCHNVEYNLRVRNHDAFSFNLTNDKTSWIIADKAIEIRIENMLLKEFGLNSKVVYERRPSPNLYLDGELSVKLLIKKQCYDRGDNYGYIRIKENDIFL